MDVCASSPQEEETTPFEAAELVHQHICREHPLATSPLQNCGASSTHRPPPPPPSGQLFLYAYRGYVSGLRPYKNTLPLLRCRNGTTLLHWAAAGGHLDMIRFLLDECHLSIHDTDKEGGTALHTAAFANQLDCMVMLLEYGANPNSIDAVQTPILVEACIRSNGDMVQYLIQHGTDLAKCDPDGMTVLQQACFYFADEEILQCILNAPGAKVDAPDMDGFRPIHSACHSGNEQALCLLMQKQQQVRLDERDHSDTTPLLVSCFRDHAGCMKRIHEGGAGLFVNDKRRCQALHLAARYGTECLKYLVSVHPDISGLNGGEFTALQFAILHRNLDAVQILLEAGAETEILSQYESTAVLYAAVGNFSDAIVLLAKHHANLNGTDKDKNTALHLACMFGYEDTVKALLAFHDVEVGLKNSKGELCIHLAASRGFDNIIKLLLGHSAQLVNGRNGMGQTALHCAALANHVSVVDLLLLQQHGADVSIADNLGKTCIHVAIQCGAKAVLEQLLLHKQPLFFANSIRQVINGRQLSVGAIKCFKMLSLSASTDWLYGCVCGLSLVLDGWS